MTEHAIEEQRKDQRAPKAEDENRREGYTFHISGMHCASCKIFIEEAVEAHDLFRNARVHFQERVLRVETSSRQTPEELADILTSQVQSRGYAVTARKTTADNKRGAVFWQALPLGLGLLLLFFWLQKSGILNIGMGGRVTPLASFLIGLVASVSSCLAVVGGLVLSLSVKIAQDDVSDTKTFIMFHIGRLASFALLGGIVGAIGGAVGVHFTLSAVLGILASAVMLLLGLQLVGALAHSAITLPAGLFRFFRRIEHKSFAPLALGGATFFLPCGFTQSMQVAALGSGSFLSGLSIMFAFALGTLPMLALLSFGSASFAQGKHAPLFFQTVGVVIIGLGLFGLFSGLAALGIMKPLVVLSPL